MTNDAINIIALSKTKGFTRQKIRSLYEKGMSDEELARLTGDENFEKTKQDVKKCLDATLKVGAKAITFLNRQLKNLPDAPLVLFYIGDISLLDKGRAKVAIIGTRNASSEVEAQEREYTRIIVRNAITVSGLALGCDSIAHDETLKCGGKTIAILPSTLYDIWPASNKALAQQITENGGLLITEYYDQTNNEYEIKKRYTDRDKLQAVFSRGILLCASGINGGSRIAMRHAAKLNKPRAVIDFGEPQSQFFTQDISLNNKLKTEKGVTAIKGDKDMCLWVEQLRKKGDIVQLEIFSL